MKYNNSLQDNSVISTITNHWQNLLGIRSESILGERYISSEGKA